MKRDENGVDMAALRASNEVELAHVQAMNNERKAFLQVRWGDVM
jgi:hypothetical protein